jgi:hypothetical protein
MRNRHRHMSTYMRLWTASALVLFCVLCFEIRRWVEVRESRINRVTHGLNRVTHGSRGGGVGDYNPHPVLLLRTHHSDSANVRLVYPITAIILPMNAHASVEQTMYLIERLIFFSQDTNLRFYIGAGSDHDANVAFNIFHNQTFNEKYVEVVVLRLPQHGRHRLHALLSKAWSEMNDFVMVVHASCVVERVWTLQDVKRGGNGYSIIKVSNQLNALQNFEQRAAHDFEHLHFTTTLSVSLCLGV